MNFKEIPQELLPVVGNLLRQARMARRMTFAQAAELVGAPISLLESLESGHSSMTTEQAQFIIAKYGGVRGDAIDSLIMQLVMEKSRCVEQTQKRKHLSLVGDDPKPWEKLQLSRIHQYI